VTTKEYNQCVDLNADHLYRFILGQLKHEENTRDVIQNSFEVLWKKHKEVDGAKAKSYLFSVAYHNMIDFIRKSKRMQYTDTIAEDSKTTEPVYTGLNEVLQKGLDRLPEIQKSVLMLRDYEGYAYKEIADIMDLTESQVKVYIFRARKFMQSYVGKLRNVI
jgi:RNA polymerase sigma factor (sigma-70 family)